MRQHRLKSILRRMYGSTEAHMGDRAALEADLLSRYRERHSKNRRWLVLLNPWNRTARLGFAGVAMCLLVVGACTTDTITEVELGKQVIMNMDADVDVDPDANPDVQLDPRIIHELVHIQEYVRIDLTILNQLQGRIHEALKAQHGVEDASVSVTGEEDGKRMVSVRILAFGSDVDGDGLVKTVTDSFPSLSHAAVTVNDLRTTYSESLASKMGRTLFGLKGDRPDPQELRLRALQELDAPR